MHKEAQEKMQKWKERTRNIKYKTEKVGDNAVREEEEEEEDMLTEKKEWKRNKFGRSKERNKKKSDLESEGENEKKDDVDEAEILQSAIDEWFSA